MCPDAVPVAVGDAWADVDALLCPDLTGAWLCATEDADVVAEFASEGCSARAPALDLVATLDGHAIHGKEVAGIVDEEGTLVELHLRGEPWTCLRDAG